MFASPTMEHPKQADYYPLFESKSQIKHTSEIFI